MPRVTVVKSARKSPGKCSKCGCMINVGDSYRWWQFAFSTKSVRCGKSECAPKPADLTRSEWQQMMIGHEETFDSIRNDLGNDLGAAASDLESLADEVEGYGEEQQEKYDNMPEGLQAGTTGQLLEERSEQASEIAEALRDAATTINECVEKLIDIEADQEDILEALAGSDHVEKPEKEEDESDEDFVERLKEVVETHNKAVCEDAGAAFDNVGWNY